MGLLWAGVETKCLHVWGVYDRLELRVQNLVRKEREHFVG